MPYIPKEQIQQARAVDLLTYLQQHEPQELIRIGNVYATRTHDSLKISNGKWYWWSRGIGGTSALDYLIKVRGYSLPDAVCQIIGDNIIPTTPLPTTQVKPNTPIFAPPARHADNRRVFAYLSSRGLDPEIINHCIKAGILYEDAQYHNCVFAGYRQDKMVYAALRGTLSHSRFVGEVGGSDKCYSFTISDHSSNTVSVFESAIDALSFLTLAKLHHQPWRSLTYPVDAPSQLNDRTYQIQTQGK